jgi:hypothetical protein
MLWATTSPKGRLLMVREELIAQLIPSAPFLT